MILGSSLLQQISDRLDLLLLCQHAQARLLTQLLANKAIDELEAVFDLRVGPAVE